MQHKWVQQGPHSQGGFATSTFSVAGMPFLLYWAGPFDNLPVAVALQPALQAQLPFVLTLLPAARCLLLRPLLFGFLFVCLYCQLLKLSDDYVHAKPSSAFAAAKQHRNPCSCVSIALAAPLYLQQHIQPL